MPWSVRIAVALVWIALMGWLIRFEAYPERFTRTLAGYSGLLDGDTLITEHWMRILDNDEYVGYTYTAVDVDNRRRARHIVLENQTHVTLNLLGENRAIRVESSAYLDAGLRLREFQFNLASDPLAVRVNGVRESGTTFAVTLVAGGQERAARIDIPDDVIIHSPMTAMTVKRLRPGERMAVPTFNPITLTRESVQIRAVAPAVITIAGERREATELEVGLAGLSYRAWIDRDGQLLRQETPMGWILEWSTPEAIFSSEVP